MKLAGVDEVVAISVPLVVRGAVVVRGAGDIETVVNGFVVVDLVEEATLSVVENAVIPALRCALG